MLSSFAYRAFEQLLLARSHDAGRSQKDHTTWATLGSLADKWLPRPRVLHPWPDRRFAVNHPRWEPGA